MEYCQTLTIHVCHSGTAEDLEILNSLKELLETDGRYYLDYIIYEDHQEKDILICQSLKKAFEQKIPIISILSKSFFDLVWPTSHKPLVLTYLTSHPERKSLHFWNVDRTVVKKYSTLLTANSLKFRTLQKQDFEDTEVKERSQLIIDKLLHPSDNLTIWNNYSIEYGTSEEIDVLPEDLEKKESTNDFQKLYSVSGFSGGLSTVGDKNEAEHGVVPVENKSETKKESKNKDNWTKSKPEGPGSFKETFAGGTVVRDAFTKDDSAFDVKHQASSASPSTYKAKNKRRRRKRDGKN